VSVLENASVGIVGAGRVGGALAVALVERGARVAAIASRRDNTARALARRLPGAAAVTAGEVVARCDWVFLTLPDPSVASVAMELPWRAGQVVVHTSGSLDLSALEPAAKREASTGSFHPLRAFAGGEPSASAFEGIAIGVTAPPVLSAKLCALATELGARSLKLDGAERALYHAAAVFASGFGVALLAAARRAWTLAGLPEAEARSALAPLLEGAAANAAAQPLERALTGPFLRGDADTIERHLAKLERAPELAALYRALGNELLSLELGLAPEALERLRRALGR
jgi:predicted short-subunit dehydrogenase-like oxidoreductase (DUF2520 family)